MASSSNALTAWSAWAVTNTTAGGWLSARRFCARHRPSCPGMWMSSSSKSKACPPLGDSSPRASLALAASRTMWGGWAAQSASRVRRRLRASVSSSTTSMFMAFLARRAWGRGSLLHIGRSGQAQAHLVQAVLHACAEVGLYVVQQRQAGAHVGQCNAVAAGHIALAGALVG